VIIGSLSESARRSNKNRRELTSHPESSDAIQSLLLLSPQSKHEHFGVPPSHPSFLVSRTRREFWPAAKISKQTQQWLEVFVMLKRTKPMMGGGGFCSISWIHGTLGPGKLTQSKRRERTTVHLQNR
jgi:hypothetical protein